MLNLLKSTKFFTKYRHSCQKTHSRFFLIPWFGLAHQHLFLPAERNLPVWPELLFQLQYFPDAAQHLLCGLSAAWTRKKSLKPFFFWAKILTFLWRRASQHLSFGYDAWIIYRCMFSPSHNRCSTWAFWTYTSTLLHWPSLYAHIHQADRGQRLTWMLELFRPFYL